MKKRLLTLFLATVIVFSVFAGCSKRDAGSESSDSSVATSGTSSSSKSSSSSSAPSRSPSSKPEGDTMADVLKEQDKTAQVKEKKTQNSDTVGWLTIPELGIDEVVVGNPTKKDDGKGPNMYYERRNFAGQNSFNGVIYADYRAEFGAGARSELGSNTTIYGHAMTDKPGASNYDIFFGPLHDLREEKNAKDTPYIFFSTEKESLAFEIVSVAFPNTTAQAAPYNTNNFYTQPEYAKFVRDVILPRSLYDYGVEIKDSDKFLTLSTCAYNLPDGTPTLYGDPTKCWYRYVITARLVEADAELKKDAKLTKNADIIQDDNNNHMQEIWGHLM